MSNSSYVNYTKISPHRNSPRNHVIDKITIHHMAGNISVETCGNVFQTREASSNYGIDSDGRVGMYVEEKDRSWASSSKSNDNRAVTIEVADNVYGGNWGCSNEAMTKLILLCADICKRNGIKQLNYTGDTSGNLTLHKWFIPTDCPGAYLESQMPKIASEVNKVIQNGPSNYSWNGSSTTTSTKTNTVKESECTVNLPILRKGSENGYVKTLQILLNKYNNAHLDEDGIFGNATYNAVVAYQKDRKLDVDGIVGAQTWGQLLK